MSPLPPDLALFVDQQLAAGKFESTDALVHASIRLLQKQQNLDELRALIQEGIDCEARGEYTDVTTEEDRMRFKDDIRLEGMKLLAEARASAHGNRAT